MEFSRQEYGSGLPFPSPGDLPDSGIEPRSPNLCHQGSPSLTSLSFNITLAYLTPPYPYAGIRLLEDKTQHRPKFLLERKKSIPTHQGEIQAHLVYCTLLYWASQILDFLTNWNFVNAASRKSIGAIFPTAFAHSVSNMGKSCNTANVFTIITFVTVICDWWFLMLLL